MKRRPRVDTYAVIARAVEEGVAYAARRVVKYAPDPIVSRDDAEALEALVKQHAYSEVMNALSDVLIWEERDHGE